MKDNIPRGDALAPNLHVNFVAIAVSAGELSF